jgi:diguanylate cyclase (GGDEF)-like protein
MGCSVTASPPRPSPAPAAELAGRAEFEERLSALCDSAPLSAVAVLLIQVDGFSRLVERHGPARADECLQHVALTLWSSLRRGTDLAVHFDGPRFGAVLPSTNLPAAQHLADTLRRRVAGQVLSLDGRMVRLTATTVACARTQGTRCEPHVLVQTAEQALERALRHQESHVSVLAQAAHG